MLTDLNVSAHTLFCANPELKRKTNPTHSNKVPNKNLKKLPDLVLRRIETKLLTEDMIKDMFSFSRYFSPG